jgi:hypothetical protein
MGAMAIQLENPLDELLDDSGGKSQMVWKAVGTGAGIVGAIAARKLLNRIGTKATHQGDDPLNPANERVSWWYAVMWAGVVGVGASLGRLAAQFIVAKVWKRSHPAAAAAKGI